MANGYREKYRQALDEQERLEKQFAFQLEAVKKTLLHVSVAAQGLDKQLDARLADLKSQLRGGSGPKVFEAMELVQKAVSDYERIRIDDNNHAAQTIEKFIEQLLELRLPKDIKSALAKFSAALKKRLTSFAEYPDVLIELAKLQGLALEASANPNESFWQRLKGGKTLKSREEPLPGEEQNIDSFDIAEQDIVVEKPLTGELAPPKPLRFDPGEEDNYEKVAQRIADTLESLVDKIEPNDVVRHKVDIVRLRIKRGMDWYALSVTLEDIRDILLLRYLEVDREFGDYLSHVNSQLEVISESLGIAIAEENNRRDATDKFAKTVSNQMVVMRSSMENSSGIDQLKTAVTDHLAEIQKALGQYQQSQVNQGPSLSEQLSSLVQKIQTIENESEKTRVLLEEQRHKATHDALTGLPNREAYNERAYQELMRFNRYGRTLTMAVCDIDHFKSINDNYGHQAGDKVLQLIAKLISARIRKVDFIARYGGEEFVVLMPETNAQQALTVLEKIRILLEKSPFKFKNQPVKITLSFGIAEFVKEDSVESAFERADNALYRAKDNGRNQCVIADN